MQILGMIQRFRYFWNIAKLKELRKQKNALNEKEEKLANKIKALSEKPL